MSDVNVILDKFDDFLNPILVKELRQTIRAKFFWILLYLFITFQTIFICMAFFEAGVKTHSSGEEIFSFLLTTLLMIGFFSIPLYYGFRFASERMEKSDELLYITTATPHQIIMGKFLAGVIFVLMIYSLYAPFMSLTFFLSGVEIFQSLFLLGFSFLFAAMSSMVLLAFAAASNTQATKNLFRTCSIGLQVIVFSFLYNYLNWYTNRYGIFSGENLKMYFGFILISLFVTYFFYGTAASTISPEGSNRLLWIRTRFSVISIITYLITIGFFHNSEGSIVWGILFTIFNSVFLLIGVSEPFDYSTRVQREVPKSKLKKYLMFPFFTGTLNAFVWCFIMQIFITVLASAGSTKLGSHADEFFLFIFSAFLSVGFYALLASFIRRRFFSNIATSSTWMIGVIVIILGIFFQTVSSVFLQVFGLAIFGFLNPFYAFNKGMAPITSSLVMFSIMMFLHLKVFSAQYLSYMHANKNG